MELFSHVPFALIAISFLLRDMVYLRLMSILASGVMIGVAFAIHENWHAIVIWNVLFVGIHLTQLAITYVGERTAKFTEEERELYETLFRNFTKLEFLKLLRAGRWIEFAPGHRITEQGRAVPEVVLISHGVADVQVDDRRVAELRDGKIVGEMSFLSGEPASATVTASEPVRGVAWTHNALKTLLDRNPSIRFALQQIFSREITGKLVQASRTCPEE